ncbi:MAG: 16S rRNA (guanine(527)-N(7))-methyltransferase RsmG [Rickettsiaceae bacterium]|nr:16S rRNA (guanine(527)-N(7))-methyltransferase RsmG [Rickettsiaceae bacterium]
MIESVSREKLTEYCELLIKWNNVINLISSKTVPEVLERHVNDSIQLLSFIKDKNISIVDLGSGGGFPGIVLSIAGIKKVTLIESDSRKAAFLLQAAKLSHNKVEVINDRIENITGLECDIITSRAFADLNKIFDLSQNIKVKDKYLLHKGQKYMEEITDAQRLWLFDSKDHDSITSDSGKILEIQNVIRIL